jgi:hypothetical protein
MKIELLTKPDCDNSTLMYGRLLEFLDPREFDVVDLTRLPSGDLRRGYYAPTLLLGGADLLGAVPRTDPSIDPT